MNMTASKYQRSSIINYFVFGFTFLVVGISMISVFFPALIIDLTFDTIIDVDPFELGILFFPVLGINLTVLVFAILYWKGVFHKSIQNSINFICKFEISSKITLIIIVILLTGYIFLAVHDINIDESTQWEDFNNVKLAVEYFPDPTPKSGSINVVWVQNFLLLVSQEIFQNFRIIPFIASISLLLTTYFLSVKISGKRFSGIISMVVLLQSFNFQRYDTSATYSSFWVLFYFLSLYFIYKKPFLSPISYVLSLFSKPIIIAYLPISLFYTLQTKLPKRKKLIIIISYFALFIVSIIVIVYVADFDSRIHKEFFNSADFWTGFTTLSFQLRYDIFIIAFLCPLIVGLLLISRKGISEAQSLAFSISFILILSPILSGFTSYEVQPYRYLPLIVFVSIGIGFLFNNKLPNSTNNSENKS